MANYQLSEGCLRLIMNEHKVKDPLVQVLAIKKLQASSSEKERYRILLSDGLNSISFAMITIQANSGAIENFSVIKLKKYLTSVINNAATGDKKVLLILEKEMVVDGRKIGKSIGQPKPLDDRTIFKSTCNDTSSSISSLVNDRPASPPNPINQSVSENKFISPISTLTLYDNEWVIKARVTSKSDIRAWCNSRGEGKFFSVVLMDESGEIKLTAFKDAVDKFYDYIQVDKVYYFSKCHIKPANKQFNTLKNDNEMTVTHKTIIVECRNNNVNVPQVKYNFITIDQISNLEIGTLIDVIGVCKSASDLQTIMWRSTNSEVKKREVQLIDQSKTAIDLTLWGSQAEAFDSSNNPVVVIRGAKVGEFEGCKNISTVMTSQLKVNPDIPECHKIKSWYGCSEGMEVDDDVKNDSERKNLKIRIIEVVAEDNLIRDAIGRPLSLSTGSLRVIMNDQKVHHPVIMQVLNTERMYHHNFFDRELYLIGLSDGVNCTSFGLYNPLPSNSGGIEAYSVIRLKQYLTTVVTFEYPTGNKDRKVLLIVDRELIIKGSGTGNKTIGDPKSID